MSDYRPFMLRRTTGGDVLRPVRRPSYGVGAALRASVVLPEEVVGTALEARPLALRSIVVTVKVPRDVDWSQAMVVRGGFGFPTTPLDGDRTGIRVPNPLTLTIGNSKRWLSGPRHAAPRELVLLLAVPVDRRAVGGLGAEDVLVPKNGTANWR